MLRGRGVCALVVLICLSTAASCSSEQAIAVEKWASDLSKELLGLGQTITKSKEIKARYKRSNVNFKVLPKEPEQLLDEIVGNISLMMERKMKAIRCIMEMAEREAEFFEYNATDTTYEYYSSKYSELDNITIKIPDSLSSDYPMYTKMYLNNDTHFYNVPVNTTHSSVHVPVNIFDRHKEARTAIQWSEALDEVFRQNYNSDPALSWQYFGSSSGIMRHYPAMHWTESDDDMFDCRIRTWFIEAATCTKDLVILVDSSGSMDGMRNHITTFTVHNILDTLSNNDYINVLNYSISFNYTVPCFESMLVQATKENINTFKKAVKSLKPENKSNVTEAFGEAFKLLAKYREMRNCSENSSCNQAVMLVTDGISRNISDIFEKYNWFNNRSNIPVRLFTYLIGQEVTKVNEIMWAACANRGYYTHVQSLEEVQGSVFKYIPVIARPLVLQGISHPISWTHAYTDLTYDDANDNVYNEPYRLLTSCAIPAFDRQVNKMNDSVTADLLGVAATDVPIDDFIKLTLPYKLGVMSYAFIISNNGYVLMHPSLRPVFNKTILKENYNSIELMEVEQRDDGLGPREINENVLKLRNALVAGEHGQQLGETLKYHYDDMSRIVRQDYNFYYAPLNNTPFSIGIAMPQKFGLNYIHVENVLKLNQFQGVSIISFFEGNNWKIHPKWLYCKYHYLEGHEFDTPENELLHFLQRLNSSDFVWSRQYEVENLDSDTDCGGKLLKEDDYYCDKDLVERLVFDAKNTKLAFDGRWSSEGNDQQWTLFKQYNATLRFVATMSGLTRWEYIYGEDEDNHEKEFGDYHSRAIDETWYKSAILQHQYDPEAFVFSVPYESGEDTTVTGSYAIFVNGTPLEAPGAVVGFQFSHRQLKERFNNITSTAFNAYACGDMLFCYVVDSSGYVLISQGRGVEIDHNGDEISHIGRFFGEIECDVMAKMLDEGIFQRIKIFDFQGLCKNVTAVKSAGFSLTTPLEMGISVVKYVVGNIFWLLMEIGVHQLWDANIVIAEDKEDEKLTPDGKKKKKKKQYYPCDLQRDLFIMQQNKFSEENDWHEAIKANTTKFFVRSIQHTNLILVAVYKGKNTDGCDKVYTTAPQDVDYGVEHPCQKLRLTTLPRRRLSGCFNENPLEYEIKTCGRSSRLCMSSLMFLLPLMYVRYYLSCFQ